MRWALKWLSGMCEMLSKYPERIAILKGGRRVSITEKAIGFIADIGWNAAKGHFKHRLSEAKAKEKLSEYLARMEKYNINCSLEEEIDFEGLAGYICGDLMDDVKLRLFGTKKERGVARQTIMDRAAHYAQAKTNLSNERARYLAGTTVDILRRYYRSITERDLLLLEAEIEDAIISEVTEQHQELNKKIDALSDKIQNGSLISTDKALMLANSGRLDEVERAFSAAFAVLNDTHRLKPYYGFSMADSAHMKSVPLLPDAVELYPPRLEFKARSITMGGIPIPNIDSNILTRAYQSQNPIEFDVIEAKKYLGNVLDPIQHEAEELTGRHIVMKPPAFPEAFPCNVIIDGEIAVEYLFLRTKQINDDGTMIVTNDEQDNFNFRVTLSLRYTTSTFSFAVSILNHSNADSLRYRQFLKKAMAAKSIVLKSLKHNTIIAASKSPLMPDNCAKIDLEIDFLQKVVTIESYFHKVLIIPDEIELSDHKTINYLYAMIVEGKYCGVCGGFSMTFNVTDELRQMLYDLDGTTIVFYCNIGMSIELFNQILDFQITREIKGMRLEDSEKAKKKLDVLDNGEPIVIPFVSDVLDADIHYCDMFYFEKAET